METLDHVTTINSLNSNNGTQQDYMRCYHCRCCGSGCPFISAMDYPPNSVIRLLQFGKLDDALSCSTIWVCVACNTCAMECPMAIDIPAMMDQLRQLAVQNRATVAEPDVLRFHQTVLDSVERYGRTHKLEIMMRFKLTTRRWLQDWQAGLKMLAKRKLDLLPSRIKHIEAIAPFFKTKSRETSDD